MLRPPGFFSLPAGFLIVLGGFDCIFVGLCEMPGLGPILMITFGAFLVAACTYVWFSDRRQLKVEELLRRLARRTSGGRRIVDGER